MTDWAELYTRLRAMLPAGTPVAEGEDAIQVVIVALWRRARPLPDRLSAYLRTCLRRALARELSASSATLELVDEVTDGRDPEGEFVVREDARRLIARLRSRAPVTVAGALRPEGHRERARLRRLHRAGGER